MQQVRQPSVASDTQGLAAQVICPGRFTSRRVQGLACRPVDRLGLIAPSGRAGGLDPTRSSATAAASSPKQSPRASRQPQGHGPVRVAAEYSSGRPCAFQGRIPPRTLASCVSPFFCSCCVARAERPPQWQRATLGRANETRQFPKPPAIASRRWPT